MPKAVEALNTYAPQARDALGNLVAQAPQVASAVFGALPGGQRREELGPR